MISPAPDTHPSGTLAVVAMSGGVDSSAAALLMVRAGYRVVGVAMRLYSRPQRDADVAAAKTCCAPDDVFDARRVAAALGIPFYVADYEELFSRTVIDGFVEAYLAGRTPNPCVACNRDVKFDALLSRARALGAQVLATGHYARSVFDERTGRWRLFRAADRAKDQSYFLYALSQDELALARFPVGGLSKPAVRALAREAGLATADKRESQEICFVEGSHYAALVELRGRGRAPGPGLIVDAEGRAVGTHLGVHRYTVGQRRGLGLPPGLAVVRLDAARNEVVVGPRAEASRRVFEVREARWVGGALPSAQVRALVQVRHRAAPVLAWVRSLAGDRVAVELDAPAPAVTPGQAAVFYDEDEVLGGGEIA